MGTSSHRPPPAEQDGTVNQDLGLYLRGRPGDYLEVG
jgi:hypothetical protein